MTTYDEYGIPVGAYSEPESLTLQARRVARAFFVYRIRPAVQGRYNALKRGDWSLRRLVTLVNVLVLVWWVVLYWGERGVFNGAVESCSWDRWENWEAGANPHRLIFVADPQLIDPHTYPGRPWPLNPLTYKYTDLYLRRTYSRFQTVLYPDTIFFLGDLFDGGREWSTRTTTSPEKQYHKYGDDFWMNEYRRFGDIFFNHWGDGGMSARPGQPGRKIISSLPGNHDLGFAKGVQIGVRNRFNSYFGDGNRIDVIANHTFVSIDSVSLSALGQDSSQQVENIWRPTRNFLNKAKEQKKRLVQRELRLQQGLSPYPGFLHHDIKSEDLPAAKLPRADKQVTDFPTILLTHVPLYRAPGTPCGPLREHWPPTPPAAGQPPLDYDDRNAISVRGGYQYQNVLNREITADLAEKVGDIQYAFSGDDHDYCEVLHRGYASAGGGIREITVKSISWAMGVRRPGVVLLSMWNPVDAQGNPLAGGGDASRTVQTHLCLLPDQIGTFLKYALLFGATVTLLVLRAMLITLGFVRVAAPSTAQDDAPLLPIVSTSSSAEKEKSAAGLRNQAGVEEGFATTDQAHSSHSSSSSDRSHTSTTLQVRSAQARSRAGENAAEYILPGSSAQAFQTQTQSQSQSQSKHTYPLVQHAGYYAPPPLSSSPSPFSSKDVKIYGETSVSTKVSRRRTRKRRKGLSLFMYEVYSGLGVVCGCGVVWYGVLVWWG